MTAPIPETLRQAFELIDQAVCLFDSAHRLVFINSKAREVFGFTADKVTPDTSFDVILEYMQAEGEVSPHMRDAMQGVPVRFECERPDSRVLEVKVEPLPGGGVMIAARDVSARYEALRAVGRSERDIRSILDQLIDTFLRVDRAGTIVMVSRSVKDLLGYQQKEVLGRKVADFYMNTQDRDGFVQALKEGGGEVSGFEAAWRHKNGGTVWVSTSAHFVFDENGERSGIEGVTRDITKLRVQADALRKNQDELTKEVEERTRHLHREIAERRQTEEDLRRSEERYALAVEAAREGIWDMDVDTDRMFLSPRIREIVETSEGWWDSKGFTKKYIHPDDAPKVRRELIAHLKGETPVMECDYRVCVGGIQDHVRWVRIRAVAVRHPDGRAYRVVGAVNDITDSRNMERALRVSEQRFRDIAKSASDWFWEMDAGLRFEFVSDRFFLLSGIDRDTVRGKSLSDLVDSGVMARSRTYASHSMLAIPFVTWNSA